MRLSHTAASLPIGVVNNVPLPPATAFRPRRPGVRSEDMSVLFYYPNLLRELRAASGIRRVHTRLFPNSDSLALLETFSPSVSRVRVRGEVESLLLENGRVVSHASGEGGRPLYVSLFCISADDDFKTGRRLLLRTDRVPWLQQTRLFFFCVRSAAALRLQAWCPL